MWTDGRYFLQAVKEMDTNWTLMKVAAADSIIHFIFTYRVIIKYWVFSPEFSKLCNISLASTGLLLVVQKMASYAIRVTANSDLLRG